VTGSVGLLGDAIHNLSDVSTSAVVGIAGAAIGILGNQIVAWYKLVVGRRINSATLIADARHSWLDAVSSAWAMAGLIAVALGQPWGDPVAGLEVTALGRSKPTAARRIWGR